MHGVQYSKNYNLVDDEFARMRESGHDSQLLAENGSLVGESCREQGGYDGTAAPATSNVVLAFGFLWCKNHGLSFKNNHTYVVRGDCNMVLRKIHSSFSSLENSLKRAQARGKYDPVKRAYLVPVDNLVDAVSNWSLNSWETL